MYYRGHLLTLLVKNYANTPYMKKIFIAIIFAALFSSVSRSQTKTHFEYPTAPDSLATLQEKTSYIVLRFWDKADMKKLLNDTLAFNEAFADYVSFIPYASADSVKKSIVNLTSRYKNDAKSTLKIVKAAEKIFSLRKLLSGPMNNICYSPKRRCQIKKYRQRTRLITSIM